MPGSKCIFCQRDAFAGNYLQPAMCEQHYSIAIMISLLRNYDLPVSPDHLSRLADRFYPKFELAPDQIGALAQPMLGGVA